MAESLFHNLMSHAVSFMFRGQGGGGGREGVDDSDCCK